MDKENISAADIAAYKEAGGKITKCPPTDGLKQTAEEAAELAAHRERQWQQQRQKDFNWAHRDNGAISKRGRSFDAPVLGHSLPSPRAQVTSPKQTKARATEPQHAAKYAQAIAALKVDQNAGKVSRELGIPASTVYRWAKAADITLTGNNNLQEPQHAAKYAQAIAALKIDPNANKVSRELGIPASTVFRWAKREGITLTGKRGTDRASRGNAPKVDAPTSAQAATQAAAKPSRLTLPSSSDHEIINGAAQRMARARAPLRLQIDAAQRAREDAHALAVVLPVILEIEATGIRGDNRGLTRALNARGLCTVDGNRWDRQAVQRATQAVAAARQTANLHLVSRRARRNSGPVA
ncbi:MAG: hypothetical protein JO166_20770 [Deltaproteobacteria bacterium]|nr:hypothetical protein [Deltaproteobacteria bacterium]